MSKPRAWLELLRLPNVFTAMADVLMGYLFTRHDLDFQQPFTWILGLLIASSSLIYLAGMVLNDFFDRTLDAKERPERPIPSGRISANAARVLGFGLLAAGVAAGWCVTAAAGEDVSDPLRPGLMATILAGLVLLYDLILKKTPLGPIAMGGCRIFNVLLGMSAADMAWDRLNWTVAAGIGAYITGVTWFARTEARRSSRPQLIAATAVMMAGLALLAWFPALARDPMLLNERIVTWRWYLFWIFIGALISRRCVVAIIYPQPKQVQMAVKNAILSLIMLDAAVCLAVQRDMLWALVVLSLLLPATLLGRWIYST